MTHNADPISRDHRNVAELLDEPVKTEISGQTFASDVLWQTILPLHPNDEIKRMAWRLHHHKLKWLVFGSILLAVWEDTPTWNFVRFTFGKLFLVVQLQIIYSLAAINCREDNRRFLRRWSKMQEFLLWLTWLDGSRESKACALYILQWEALSQNMWLLTFIINKWDKFQPPCVARFALALSKELPVNFIHIWV